MCYAFTHISCDFNTHQLCRCVCVVSVSEEDSNGEMTAATNKTCAAEYQRAASAESKHAWGGYDRRRQH